MARTPLAISDTVSDEELEGVLQRVAANGEEVDNLVYEIVDKYCEQVDYLINRMQQILDQHSDMSDEQINFFIMQIPVKLYYTTTAAEALGIREDVSKLLYKEKFNTQRKEATGTVSDKDAAAALHSNPEALAAVVYTRASRMVKAKLDMAYEMLNALKKVLSHRIASIDLEKSNTGKVEK